MRAGKATIRRYDSSALPPGVILHALGRISAASRISQDAGTLDFNNYLKHLLLDDDVPQAERERCAEAWAQGVAQSKSADSAQAARKRERVKNALALRKQERRWPVSGPPC